MAVGIEEAVREDHIRARIGQVEYVGERLHAAGVPIVRPIGGHAVYIDAKRLYSHIAPQHYPGQALVCELYRLAGNVCNRGTADLPPGMPSTFYLGDPRVAGAKAVCTASTTAPVAVGACLGVVCEWMNPTPGPYDLWFRVNDDGTGRRPAGQCKSGNDLAHLPGTSCGNSPG